MTTTGTEPRTIIGHMRPVGPSAGRAWTVYAENVTVPHDLHDVLGVESGASYVGGPTPGHEDVPLIVTLRRPVVPTFFRPARIRAALLVASAGPAVLGVRVAGFPPRPARGKAPGSWLVNEPIEVPGGRRAHEHRTNWGPIPPDTAGFELHTFSDARTPVDTYFRVLAAWGEVELVEDAPTG